MRLSDALGIRDGDVVALVGAGGKTSALRRVAAEWAAAGRAVVVSTTTKIEAQSGAIATVEVGTVEEAVAAARGHPRGTPLLVVGGRLPDIARLQGLPPATIDALGRSAAADLIVVQADGSSRRSFKAPASHEPVVPASTTLVVAVCGADAFGGPIDGERCHRPERVAALGGAAPGATLTPAVAAAVHTHPDGPFRATPAGARRAVLVNKVEGAPRLEAARAFAAALRAALPIPVVLASVRSEHPVVEVIS